MTNAAMQADHCDFKIIKTRKVIQIVLEIPQEAGDAFIAAFGLPRSDTTIPVALAKLNPIAAQERPKGGTLAKKAGIVCGEQAFVAFVAHKENAAVDAIIESGDAAQWLRFKTGVSSRAELDHNPEAAAKFRKLMDEYEMWLARPDLVG